MKYDALKEHLSRQSTAEVPMTFREIEGVIGKSLPEKASQHRAWWSNNPSNNVMTKAWLDAGYRSERVDMASRRLVFRRQGQGGGATSSGRSPTGGDRFSSIYGVLQGKAVVHGDITAPTGERWEAAE